MDLIKGILIYVSEDAPTGVPDEPNFNGSYLLHPDTYEELRDAIAALTPPTEAEKAE